MRTSIETTTDFTDKVWFNGQGSQPGQLLPAIDPTQSYTIDGNGVVENAVFNANGAETATLYQENTSQANNFQWATKFNNGGPLRGDFVASYSKATSDLQAAQADVEHGLYTAFPSGTPTSPTAPGCNNGGSTCATGNHGYEFQWWNGGSSGLPKVSYLAPYADVLSNPAYTTFKSNWAWANSTNAEDHGGEVRPELGPGVHAGSGGHDLRRRALRQARRGSDLRALPDRRRNAGYRRHTGGPAFG